LDSTHTPNTSKSVAESEADTHASPSVLIIGNFLSAAKYTRGVCEELALHLAAAGWQVTTTSDKPNRILRLIDMVTTAWSKRSQYDSAQVDVFSGNAFLWAEVVCWVLRRVGKSYILTLHGGDLPNFVRRWPGRVKRLLHSAKAITTPSAYLYEQMQPYADDLIMLPNPLDIHHYEFHLREHTQPHLLWLRAFHFIYNPALAIEVVAKLVDEFPAIHLTMIGPDHADGSLQAVERAIETFNIAEHITLVGGVPKTDVPQWLNKGDIFINTTNIDNTPVSVIEAMACGLCVVSTNVGGIPYLLKDQLDACLVPPNNPEAMADIVRRILSEPSLAKGLSYNVRMKAELFDWSVVLPQWEQLFLEISPKG
jgi:glycosyltransferase involved in cell wall biosynthesis